MTSVNDNNNEKENQKEGTSGAAGSGKKAAALNKEKKVPAKKDADRVAVKKEKAKNNWMNDLKRYLRGVVSEVKKVHWLGTREVVIYTIVVFVAVMFVGSLIWLFDSLLTMVLRLVM